MRYYIDELNDAILDFEKKDREERFNRNLLSKKKRYKLYEITGEPIIIKSKKKKNKKNKKKGIITSVVALGLAGVATVSYFFIAKKIDDKNKDGLSTSNSISQKADDLQTRSLDSLGKKLPNKKNQKTEYEKVSGDFNIEDVVRGADGDLYDSQESADNASKSGTTVTDTKGGTLVVEDDGNVYVKEKGYEIHDEDGNVVESGDGDVPESEKDEEIRAIECPYDFYDDNGDLIHEKGELITPKTLEDCKRNLHTEKPKGDEYAVVEEEIVYFDVEQETTAPEPTTEIQSDKAVTGTSVSAEEVETQAETQAEETVTTSSKGTENADGTYTTIYGVTYSSYADYQQYIIDGGQGYGYIDGIIQPLGDYEIDYQYTR